MTRKIKGLGIAFVAIAAMSMAAASTAQATPIIEITATAECTGTVREQHDLSHIQLTNVGTASHNITISGIAYEGHGLCPSLPATTVTNNGQYTGQLTIQAFTDTGSNPSEPQRAHISETHSQQYQPQSSGDIAC